MPDCDCGHADDNHYQKCGICMVSDCECIECTYPPPKFSWPKGRVERAPATAAMKRKARVKKA